MSASGDSSKELRRSVCNHWVTRDLQGAKLSSDTGIILMRLFDQRHGIIRPMVDVLDDALSSFHIKHSLIKMNRQRIYQMTGGYEDCNDANFLRVDSAVRFSLSKGKKIRAGQSAMTHLKNNVLGNWSGLVALDEAILRSVDDLIKRKDKYRLIIDRYSTEGPAYGKQEGCTSNGHFGKTCYHPIMAFSGEGDCLGGE